MLDPTWFDILRSSHDALIAAAEIVHGLADDLADEGDEVMAARVRGKADDIEALVRAFAPHKIGGSWR